MNRAPALLAALAWFAGFRLIAAPESAPPLSPAHSTTRAPTLFQSAPGHFEIAAVEAGAADRVAAQAEDGWHWLAAPLGLPERFSTPVFARLVPATEWGSDATPFHVIVEPGAVVSLRIRWADDTPDVFVRRALVQALLMRLAVAQHGVSEKLTAPLWLELGAAGWWQTHAAPAQLDALKQESARFDPPPLADLLGAQRGEGEPRGLTVGSIWLLAWLQAESGRAGEWAALQRQLLGGADASTALATAFPGRFANDRERELWWQLGWHQLRRARTLPTLAAAESRAALAALDRFVFTEAGREAVVPLEHLLAHSPEPLVTEELARRANELNRLLPALHPFYRNAGLSLAAALTDRRDATPARCEQFAAAFAQDWSDARELEAASTAALDAREKAAR